jgi:hypothetical protein
MKVTDSDKRVNDGTHLNPKSGKYAIAGMILMGILALVALFVFRGLVKSNTKKASLKIPISKDQYITMDVENDTQPISDVLQKIFGEENAKRDFQNLLVRYDEYSPTDNRIVEAFRRLSLSDEVPRTLKEMASKREPPFNERLQKVQISFPKRPGFPDSEAVVCDGSSLFQNTIYLANETESEHVLVRATRTRPCQPDEENVQITVPVARQLFGERPLNKFELGWAGVNNP